MLIELYNLIYKHVNNWLNSSLKSVSSSTYLLVEKLNFVKFKIDICFAAMQFFTPIQQLNEAFITKTKNLYIKV